MVRVRSMRRPRYLSRSRVASSAQCMSSNTASALVRSSSSSVAVKIASRLPPELTAANNAPCVCRAMSCRGPSGRGVKSASQAPHSTRAARCCFEKFWISAVLPMPASPYTSATQPPRSAAPSHSVKSARHCSRSSNSIECTSRGKVSRGSCKGSAGGAQSYARPPSRLEPAAPLEVGVRQDRGDDHQNYGHRVATDPGELRHEVKVHAIYAGDERRRQEYDRGHREDLDDVVLLDVDH